MGGAQKAVPGEPRPRAVTGPSKVGTKQLKDGTEVRRNSVSVPALSGGADTTAASGAKHGRGGTGNGTVSAGTTENTSAAAPRNGNGGAGADGGADDENDSHAAHTDKSNGSGELEQRVGNSVCEPSVEADKADVATKMDTTASGMSHVTLL